MMQNDMVLVEIKEEKMELGNMVEETTYRLAHVVSEHEYLVVLAPNEISFADVEFYQDFLTTWYADYGFLKVYTKDNYDVYKIKVSKDDDDTLGY